MSSELASLARLHCKPGATLLAASELARHMQALADWTHGDKRLTKTFRFANYYETMAFVNAVAWIAHREDHHPDLSVHYNRVEVAYSTHDAGGVTLNDCICAAKVETL
ncbi:MAG TPA: 4a-hydroxytetrahydrobiopterin dehydratase [Casimicrobiaceae bacterium]|nr:4a-hydroxytetrahydrobiopterin dehydratase [Casimicrobiaceae bacterium]